MARRESLVLLLDVGPSMHSVLPEVENVCSMLVQKKIMFNKNDEVGVVAFGTQDTDNELEKEVGGYEHVVVLQSIKVVDGDAVDTLRCLPRGTCTGDFLDAIIVGMDMLIKKYGFTNKGKHRLCLISDLLHATKEPEEGTKEDQVNAISQQMRDHGMRLESIVIRPTQTGYNDRKVLDENDHLLNQFSKSTIAKSVYVESPTSLLGALRTRNIFPVTVFRGELELSPAMKIKVWVYKKTGEEKFPTLKRYSDKAPPTDRYATHEVKIDYQYKRVEDPDKVVPPEQRIRGYRYGPQVVPISTEEWEAVKFKPEKSVKLLGFTDSSNILRHYYMKDVYLFIPEPGNNKAIVATSAITRAMEETNKVAILRCVWRQNQNSVIVGVLRPNISRADNIPDSFYFNVLPFAEDVREFQFPSFNSLPSSWQPSEQQQKAADDLVMSLDLAASGEEEVLRPDFTPNPVLERFYRFLETKSRNPDADVPPLDRTLKRITEPDTKLLSQNKSVIDNLHSQFELKENPKRKKSSGRALRERPSISNEEKVGDKIEASDVESIKLIKDSSTEVMEIGKLNPVQDFEAMLSRRDGSDWVKKAIKGMQDYIYDLLEDSYHGNTYPEAFECLAALRKGCILEQEPKEYNEYLHKIHKKFKTFEGDFFTLIPSKNLSLISKSEAIDSDVTDEEAKNFPVKGEMMS